MFKPKMSPDYSHFNSNNFDLFLAPHVGRLKEIFEIHLDALDLKTKINLVDFGTNDGKNIFPFLKIIIELIRRRSTLCEICVTLIDKPTNDFTTLAKNVEDFKKEMKDNFLTVHIISGCAYQRCLPNEFIDIGTCSLVIHWLSEYVVLENALFYVPGQMVSDEEKTNITSLAAKDWTNFIQSRSNEMKKAQSHINEICSSTFYQLYQRNVISKEELRNTFIPINNARTEADVRAPFVEYGREIGVKILHLSERKVTFYENKDAVASLRSWMIESLMAGLCQTRNYDDARDICDLFFRELRSRLFDREWANVRLFDVIIQKL